MRTRTIGGIQWTESVRGMSGFRSTWQTRRWRYGEWLAEKKKRHGSWILTCRNDYHGAYVTLEHASWAIKRVEEGKIDT